MVCFTFMVLISALFLLIGSLIVSRKALAVENLALRQQLAVLNRKVHRPQLRRLDRFFWVVLSQLWKHWREVLIIVKPETVIKFTINTQFYLPYDPEKIVGLGYISPPSATSLIVSDKLSVQAVFA